MNKKIKNVTLFFVLLIGVLGNVFASAAVHDGSKISVEKGAVESESIKAWEVLIDNPLIRVNILRLEDVSNYLIKNPGTEAAIKQELINVGQYKDEFLNGIKNALEDLSLVNGSSALPLEIAEAVTKIKQHRIDIGIPSDHNFGYLQGNLDNFSFNGNDFVQSGAPDNLPEIFQAINVPSNSSWLRTTDSEYKMLNRLANNYGATSGSVYTNATGTLRIVSERAYCTSCQGVIQQFNNMFPNVKIILVDGVR